MDADQSYGMKSIDAVTQYNRNLSLEKIDEMNRLDDPEAYVGRIEINWNST